MYLEPDTGVPQDGVLWLLSAAIVAVLCFSLCAHQYLVQSRHQFTKVTMSSSYTSSMLQDTVAGHVLDLKSRPQEVKAKGKNFHLFFIEDLNTAKADGVTGKQEAEQLSLMWCKIRLLQAKA